MADTQDLRFDNSFAALTGGHSVCVGPQPLRGARLAAVSPDAASLLDLGEAALNDDVLAGRLSGQFHWPGAHPVACRYAGHQFVHYVPNLGSGRAVLLGEAGDYGEIDRLRRVLARPFDEQPFALGYAEEPPPWGRELVVGGSS